MNNDHVEEAVFGEPIVQRMSAPAESEPDALWQASCNRYREWFDFAPDGYLISDLQGVIREANYAAARLLKTRKEFLLDKPLGLLLEERYRSNFYRRLLRLPYAENIDQWEVTLGRRREEARNVLLSATLMNDTEGGSFLVRWILRDISPVRRAESAWHQEKSLADCLVDSAEIFILVLDLAGRILRCNPFLLTATGYAAQELIGQSWWQTLLPDADRAAATLLLQRGKDDGTAKSAVLGLLTRGGLRFVTWTARRLDETLILVGQDVTELQEAQQQALRSERLAAIGQTIAGLAHESRNALQRSQACLSVLQIRLQNQPEMVELLRRMQNAQDDLQRLFDDVRAYASTPRLRMQTCDLRRAWREAWDDLGGASRHHARLSEDIGGVDTFCQADPFYLKHVFRNLLENALSCGVEPVRITIGCRAVPASEPRPLGSGGVDCSLTVAARNDDALQVSVRDNGPGFPPEVRQRLFEPFFTTKLRGSGLGLAICTRIIEAHGGQIHASDAPGGGAEIILTLPRRRT